MVLDLRGHDERFPGVSARAFRFSTADFYST